MFVTFQTILGYRKARKYRRDYVGYLFQDYALIPDQTVYDNINLAARPNKILSTKAMLTQIAQALDQVGLARCEHRTQQRVAIARLLVRPPKVVLADEPTGALDHDNSLRVIAHLRDLADGGASVVVATHSDLVADSADQHIKVAGVRLLSGRGRHRLLALPLLPLRTHGIRHGGSGLTSGHCLAGGGRLLR